MALPNNDPIFSKIGAIASVEVTAANTKSDGTGTIGTDIFLAASLDATNGGFVRDVTFWPTATVAATATTSTTARVFWSSVSSGTTTVANTIPLGEVSLTSQTAASATVGVYPQTLTINRALPPGNILVTNHAAPASNTKQRAVVSFGAY